MLDQALLLGVAKNLAWVLGRHDVEEFVVFANLRRVVMVSIDKLLKKLVLDGVLFRLFLKVIVFVVRVRLHLCSTLVSCFLLISLKHLLSLFVTDLACLASCRIGET